jgi:hypothetical protein
MLPQFLSQTALAFIGLLLTLFILRTSFAAIVCSV